MISENQVRKYCYQDISLIENYYKAVNDKEHIWDCHHRVETIMNCGLKELKAQGCYYHRPAHDLIFIRHDEHKRLHNSGNKYWLGKTFTEEHRRKLSEKKKGNKNLLGHHHSEETRRKMSESRKKYLAGVNNV